MEHNRVIYERPYDAEVEYLESILNSTYIDTLLKPSNNIDCEILAQRASVAFAADAIFGGGIEYGSSYGVLPHKNTEIILLYGNDSEYIATNNCFAQPWVVKNVGRKFYINNTEYELSPSTEEWTFNYNIYLFACNYSGIVHRQTSGYIRIYYAKFWDNGVLVRDFIPVRVGNIGYMYDKVSKKLFANKGTGNFILGSDVANPVPNIRRVFRFGNKRFVMPMPYDSKVEYLESTGTQYIDLDYICSTNTIISVTVLPTQSKVQQRFIGCNSTYFEIYQNGSNYYGFASNGTTNISSIKVNTTSKRKLTLDNVTAKGYVGNSVTTISKNTSNYFNKMFLLTRPSYHPERAAVCRLYAASITDGDFKMDLIPVRKNGIGYMYDRISCRLFGNLGTGNFIIGNDIND